MRIGEILILREALDPWVLNRTLQEQPATGQRLVSVLISRALIESDDGTLALSEQQNYPGAMQRHLERRDPSVIDAIPAEVGRRWGVLPIGRSRRGGLVVVARDPTPILAASLQHIAKTQIELAVTPAIQLERLLRSSYGELEVDEAVPRELPALPASGSGAIDFANLQLDAEDPTIRRPRTVSRVLLDPTPELPRARKAPSITKELDGTLQQIERAINRAAAEQHAMRFAEQRWSASLLMTISEGAAIARRGHGARLSSVDGIIVPVDAPSMIQRACATHTATASVPASEYPGPPRRLARGRDGARRRADPRQRRGRGGARRRRSDHERAAQPARQARGPDRRARLGLRAPRPLSARECPGDPAGSCNTGFRIAGCLANPRLPILDEP